jgi:hypothetical protein
VILVDVNILVYASIDSSPQHEMAREWLDGHINGSVASRHAVGQPAWIFAFDNESAGGGAASSNDDGLETSGRLARMRNRLDSVPDRTPCPRTGQIAC